MGQGMEDGMSLSLIRGRRGWVGALSIVAALALGSVGSKASVIVVNDTWQDSSRTDPASPVYSENGVDSDNDTNIESAWFNAGTSSTMTATQGALTTAAGAAASESMTTFFTPEASPVTLTNAGDAMRVTWVFTPSGVNLSNTSQNFRLALVKSPTGSRISADASPNSSTYGSAGNAAYAMFMNMGQTTGNGNSFQLKKRSVATSSDLLSTSGNWGTALAN